MKRVSFRYFLCLAFAFTGCKTVPHFSRPDFSQPPTEWADVFFQHKPLRETDLNGPVKQWRCLEYNYLIYQADGRLLTDTVHPPRSWTVASYNRKGLLETEESFDSGFFSTGNHKSYRYDGQGRLQKALYTTDRGFCDTCCLLLTIDYRDHFPLRVNHQLSATIDSTTYFAELSLQYSWQHQTDTLLLTEKGIIRLLTNRPDTGSLTTFGLQYDPKENNWNYPTERRFWYNSKGRLIRREENILLSTNDLDLVSKKRITEITYHASGKKRSEKIANEKDSSQVLKSWLEYDTLGNEVKNMQYNEDSSTHVILTIYDGRQQVLNRLTQDHHRDGIQPLSQVSNLYTAGGQLSQQFHLLPDTAHRLWSEESDHQLLSSYTYFQYNEKGQLCQAKFYTDSGSLGSILRYHYNAQKLVERRIEEFYYNGRIQGISTFVFTYDRYGNVTRQYEYHNGLLLHLKKYNIDYY